MKTWVALAVGTGLLLNGQAVDAKADKKETKWKLVWSDEFQAKQLDRTKWTYDTGNWIKDANGQPVSPGWATTKNNTIRRNRTTRLFATGNSSSRRSRKRRRMISVHTITRRRS